MPTVLVDHNLEGQSVLIAGTLLEQGWLTLIEIRFTHLADEHLATNSSDRVVWRFAQQQGMVLLTANRRMSGADTLEQTIREENTPASLPVLTVTDAKRVQERDYRERCAERLAEVLFDLDDYRGIGRIFIP